MKICNQPPSTSNNPSFKAYTCNTEGMTQGMKRAVSYMEGDLKKLGEKYEIHVNSVCPATVTRRFSVDLVERVIKHLGMPEPVPESFYKQSKGFWRFKDTPLADAMAALKTTTEDAVAGIEAKIKAREAKI